MSGKLTIGINGFGRIGRAIFRAFVSNPKYIEELDIRVINVGTDDIENYVHLLRWDSTYGHMNVTLLEGENLYVANHIPTVEMIAQIDHTLIDWQNYGVDLVFECTGKFASKLEASKHVEIGGAERVVVSAPCKDADCTIVYGVNESNINLEKDIVISAGSCTTNCVSPVFSIIDESFGIANASVTTVHAITNDQALLDSAHRDLRRGRCFNAIIPTSTGAASTVEKVLPQLSGKVMASSIRVPVQNVSLADMVITTQRQISTSGLIDTLIEAKTKPIGRIIDLCYEELVSGDFNSNSNSAIIDMTQLSTIGENVCKIAAWYDNEYAFSCRMLDIATYIRRGVGE